MRSYDRAAFEISSMRPPASPCLAKTLVAAFRIASRVSCAACSRTPGRRASGDLLAGLRRGRAAGMARSSLLGERALDDEGPGAGGAAFAEPLRLQHVLEVAQHAGAAADHHAVGGRVQR